jgi:receptor protein-tyrosine kinase
MGEISEALRRARDARHERRPSATPSAVPETRAGNEAMLPDTGGTSHPMIEISNVAEGSWAARAVLVEPQSAIAEQYRHCAIRLSRRMKEREASIVAVTSAARGDGKTTTACNLAFALASTAGGRRIALAELDLRRPSQVASLGIQPEVGFESVLSGDASLADARIPTQLPDLDLFPILKRPADPLEVIANPRTAATLKELARRYDTVIVDTPPVLAVSDVPLLLPVLDAVLFVVTAGESRKHAVDAALGLIGHEKILGLFVNRSNEASQKKYYRYEYASEDEAGEATDGE